MIKRSFTWLCFVVIVTWLLSLSLGAAAGPLTPAAQNVSLVGQIGGTSYAVAVAGHHAYIGVGPRLAILDIADPVHPTMVGQTAPLPDLVRGVAVAGSYAYVADGLNGGLRVINVMNPAAPVEVGAVPGYADGVAVAGSHAYVTDAGSGLRMINVANPAAPVEAGAIDTPGSAQGVAVAGSYAYVADGDSGLRVINVANPASAD